MFKMAVSSIIKDEGFALKSEKAQRSILLSERLLEWMEHNKEEADVFAKSLVHELQECVKPQGATCHKQRENMWGKYFKLCSTEKFRKSWAVHLQSSIGSSACPIFYQYVTCKIMEELIRNRFVVPELATRVQVASLGYEERNALRYTAGYVIRSLTKKVERSSHPHKKELIFCLKEISADSKHI